MAFRRWMIQYPYRQDGLLKVYYIFIGTQSVGWPPVTHITRKIVMSKELVWTPDLDTGIGVIDKQHRRIVDYINQLHDARTSGHKHEDIGLVLDELVDYTLSHFAFEESMQEEAKYPFLKAHKKVHDLFVKRVGEYQERFKLGEDVSEELNNLLVTWLFNHIKRDDADYVASVKANLEEHGFTEKKKGFFNRLFG